MIAANNNTLVFFGLFLVGLLFVPLSVSFMVPEADADHLMVTVQNAPGSSYVGCEETNSCFLPSTVTIDVGGTVTWENPDNVPHTVTSGTSSNGPDGYFDSSLIMVGQSYSNTFDSAGTYTYFCMIHPWMAGTVTVTAEEAAEEESLQPTIVQNAPGSSTPGCEETDSCFTPYQATIPVGGTVMWENSEVSDHTITSGTPQAGPSGHFNSETILIDSISGGGVFSHTFDEEGTWYYFCMVHPWMIGKVVVGDGTPIQTAVPEEVEVVESDTTPPNIVAPGNISIETTDSAGKIFVYDTPAASDNVEVTVGPTCTPASGTLLPVGTTTVTCTASDSSGNVATASFTVTVVNTAATGDTSPPVLSQISTIVKETALSNGAVVTYNHPTATDNEAVTYGPVCLPSTGSLFSIGTTTVTCIAKDAAGNQGSSSFDIIVVGPGSTIEESTVSFQLDKNSYFTGDSITVTGTSTAENVPVTLQVYSPSVELISVSQATPGSAVSQSSGTQITVQNVPGSSFTGCEPNCFLPRTVTIDVGGTVIWQNPDNVPHTATSGSPFGGPDGYFNSSLISAGSSFSHQFNASGTYDYYCIVHPWMQGNVVVTGSQTASAQPEGSGSFATQILAIGPLWSEDGTYTVKASVGVVEATKTFNFTVRELDAIPFTSVPSNIAVSINKDNYTGDETISINVALIDGSASQPISIQVNDPVGVTLFLQTVNTDSQAHVSSQFTLPENVVSGTYTVSASSKGQLWDLTDSVAFTGIPLEPEILSSSISITDERGESVTSYNAGDLGYFSTKMTTKTTSQILVTVSVLDAQLNTLGVGFFKTVLPKGDAEIVLGFAIPEGTMSGDAQVFTNFFTDWPDQGGISIGEEISSKVNIIGVEPVEEEPVVEPVTEYKDVGDFYLTYEPTEDFKEYEDWLKTEQYFESQIPFLNSQFKLPYDVEIRITECPSEGANAFWYGGEITFCYELISLIDNVFEEDVSVLNVIDWILYHELGHAFIAIYDLPTTGMEEDVADQFSSYIMLEYTDAEIGQKTMIDTAIFWGVLSTPTAELEYSDFADEHSLNLQRFSNLACWTYGFNPNDNQYLVDDGLLPESRADGCEDEYTQIVNSWDSLLAPFLQEEPTVIEPITEQETVVEPVIEPVVEPESSGMQATVQNAPGSSFEGCEPNCFLPSTVTIDLGGTVTWENPDDFPHTMTSGTSANGPDGHFDSSLIMAGDSFSHTFDTAGTYDYFCMIHPWMTGKVVVAGSETVVEPVIEQEPESSGMQATVQNAPGSSFEGCEETNSCFLPNTVTIDVGGTVTWENPDNAGHTTTSRVVSQQGAGGIIGLEWDSGFMTKGQSFSHTFDTEGTYDYFCMVHPWMQGIVVVQGEEEEEPPPLVQEEVIEVVNILALNGTSNIISLAEDDRNSATTCYGCKRYDPREYIEVDKSSLNDEHEKLTVSSWVKPDFIPTAAPQYSAVSKEGSFELFLTNTKDPERSPGFSVFDGIIWNTILIDSKVADGWHHLVGVVNGEELSVYLDSVLVGTKSMPSQFNFNEQGQLVPQTAYMAASENAIIVGALINSVSLPIEILNPYQGLISEVNIITDALTSEQVSNLYLIERDVFQRDFVEVESVINGTVTTSLVTTESPELPAAECVELANERGLSEAPDGVFIISIIEDGGAEKAGLQKDDLITGINGVVIVTPFDFQKVDLKPGDTVTVTVQRDGQQMQLPVEIMPSPDDPDRGLIGIMRAYAMSYKPIYTLVCQFPFDVIIPINSRVLWMETLSLENAPYHSIQSVDNLFGTGSMVSADMGFYDNTFTYGVYEYYDSLDESLTGKIIISKPTNSININLGSASPECADTYSCYDTFVAQVDVGEKVTWQNQDTLYHTVTSGTPGNGPDGLFDSGLIATYFYFSYTFEEAGTYDYFCSTHPWMQGKVVVGDA